MDVSGDTLKPGADGHIRHPREKDLVWWEDSITGERYWVRQNRWMREVYIKTERAPTEVQRMAHTDAVRLKKQCREDGIRYKTKPVAFADWNADEGPWEYTP